MARSYLQLFLRGIGIEYSFSSFFDIRVNVLSAMQLREPLKKKIKNHKAGP